MADDDVGNGLTRYRLDQLDSRFDSLENQLRDLEQLMQDIRASTNIVNAHANKIADQHDRINQIERRVDRNQFILNGVIWAVSGLGIGALSYLGRLFIMSAGS